MITAWTGHDRIQNKRSIASSSATAFIFMTMKRSKSWIYLMSIASFFCTSSAQCDGSGVERGETSLECSVDSPNISYYVGNLQLGNPGLRKLEVVCTDLDMNERLVVKDLQSFAYGTVRTSTAWNYTTPKFSELVNSTNVICEMTGCYYASGLHRLPVAQCSIRSFLSTSVVVPSISATMTAGHTQVLDITSSVVIPSSLISVEATTNGSEYTLEPVSTPVYTLHQTTITPSKELPSQAPTVATNSRIRKEQYYITLLAFPIFPLILVVCAIGCIIKQRTDSKRKRKEIKLGNWIINDNLQYDVTPINLQKAIIHCSASSSTLYSGLLFHNLAEATFAATTDGSSVNYQSSDREESWSSDHYSNKDTSVQPSVNENVDASDCSVYGNNAVGGIDVNFSNRTSEICPGYTANFQDNVPELTSAVAPFEETNDDQYVFYDRDREEDSMSELNFDQLDDGIQSNNLMFLSTTNGYIKN